MMAFDANLSLKRMARPLFLVENHSRIEISQLLDVAGFVAVFIEAGYVTGEVSNAVFSYWNLPCYVPVPCGLHYVRAKMFVRFFIAISALLFVLPSWAQPVKYGSPSILSQCLDPPSSSTGYVPSTRARECTRLYCAQPEYRALVEAVAMRRPQSEENQNSALICITRSEQDQQKK